MNEILKEERMDEISVNTGSKEMKSPRVMKPPVFYLKF